MVVVPEASALADGGLGGERGGGEGGVEGEKRGEGGLEHGWGGRVCCNLTEYAYCVDVALGLCRWISSTVVIGGGNLCVYNGTVASQSIAFEKSPRNSKRPSNSTGACINIFSLQLQVRK